MWQPQSFQPDQAQPQSQGWTPQSFQPSGNQPASNSPTQGEGVSPSNPSISNDQQNSDPIQRLSQWSNTPTTVDLSDIPNSGQGLNLAQKLGYAAMAAGRGLGASVEDTFIKPPISGLTELMQRSANPMLSLAPLTDSSGSNYGNISPNALSALTMMSPTSVANPSNMIRSVPDQKSIGNQAINYLSSKVPENAMADSEDNSINTLLSKNSTANMPVSSADAKAISSKFYDIAKQSGDTFPPEFTNKLIDETTSQAPQTLAGKATTGTTPIVDLSDRWQTLRDQPLDMKSIQEMDEGLGNLIDNEIKPNGTPTKAGKQLLDVQSNLRNMVMDADVGEGGQALQNARQAWSQGAKMSDIERIMTRAENSDNPATAIKSGVRTMLSNPSRIRGWSDEELQALKDAGDRGALGGALHVFGSRLGPLLGGAAGSVGGIPGAIAGSALTYGLSSGARSLATQMQMNKAQNVLNFLGKGVPTQ